MTFKTVVAADTLRVALCGELDQHAAVGLRASFALLVADVSIRHMEIDCREVALMDSSGIGLLLCWYRALTARQGQLSLHNVQPVVLRVLRISGIHRIVDISDELGGKSCTAKTI